MKKISASNKIIIGLVLGIVFGLICNLLIPKNVYDVIRTNALSPIGTIFLNALKVSVIPLVMLSIVSGVASLGDPKKLGKVGGGTILIYLVTTVVAVAVGLLIGSIFKPGAGVNLVVETPYEGKQGHTIVQMIVNMFSSNIFKSMLDYDMMAVLVFSIIIGLCIIYVGNKAKGLLDIIEQANLVMMKFIELFMMMAPLAVFCLIAKVVGDLGIGAMLPLFKYLLCILIGCVIQVFVVYGAILRFGAKKSILRFLRKFSKVMSFAFSSQSSTATIPLNINVCEHELGIKREITSFTIPLGATVNMDGTSILMGVAVLFIAQYSNVSLTFVQILTVVITATLATIGAAGMPGTALIMLTAVLQSVGLPIEAVALLLGVDRVADMIRTTVNVTGDAVASLVVAKRNMCFDEQVFDA